MEQNISTPPHEHKKKCGNSSHQAASGIYGLGLIGAAVFYMQSAESFWLGALGLLKAFVWPAILVYKLLELVTL